MTEADHETLFLLAIKRTNPRVSMGRATEEYRAICARTGLSPRTSRMLVHYAQALASRGVIRREVVSHGRFGRTSHLTVIHPNGFDGLRLRYDDPETSETRIPGETPRLRAYWRGFLARQEGGGG